MEATFCQSCGMPMTTADQFGTEKDGSTSHDFCVYCYKEGAFTEDVTMDEMINHCVQYLDDFNKESEKKFTKEEAIAQMKEFFPHLKRWKKN